MSARKIVMKVVSISFSVLVIVLLVYALAQAGKYAYQFGYRVFTETAVAEDEDEGEDVIVSIEDGMSAGDVGALLEEKGLIRDKYLFFLQLKLSAYSKKIKPGIYTLNTSMRAEEMMQIMSGSEEETETEEEQRPASEQPASETETEKSTQGTEGGDEQ